MARIFSTILLSSAEASNVRLGEREHTALLQGKNGQPQHAEKSASVRSEVDHPDKLQHVDKHISNLETRLQQDPKTVEASEIQDLEDVVKLLADEFGGELARQHDEDVAEYGSKTDLHNACQSTKDDKLRDLVGPKASAVAKTRETHSNCRKAEDALKKYVNDAKQVADTWTNLADYKQSPGLPGNANVCLATTGSHDNFHTLVAQYNAAENSGSCDADQDAFEGAFCFHFEEKSEVCIEMDTCVSTVDLAGLKSKYEDRIKHRKSMDLTLAKLDCRLNHVIDVYKAQLEQGGKYNPNDLKDNCDSVTGNPSNFDMTMDVPALVTCSSDADISNPIQPSIEDATACAAWKNQEYINPPGGQLPGDSWACKRTCITPQAPANPPANEAANTPSSAWPSLTSNYCNNEKKSPWDQGGNVKTSTAEECQALCEASDTCLGITYGLSGAGACCPTECVLCTDDHLLRGDNSDGAHWGWSPKPQ